MFDRLKEPSTYGAIAAALAALGPLVFDPGTWAQIMAIAAAVTVAVGGVVLKEGKK